MRRRTFIRAVLLLAALSVALSAVFYAAHVDLSGMVLRLSTSHRWLAPPIYMGAEFAATVLPLPNAVTALLGGYMFGPALGTLYTIIPAMAGSLLLFWFAHKGKEALTSKFLKKEKDLARVNSFLGKEHGFYSLVFIRFSPLFPNDVLSLLLGFTSISLRRFVLTTFLGYLVPFTTMAYIEALFAEFGGDFSTADTLPLFLLLTVLSVAGLVVAFWGPLMRRFRRNLRAEPEGPASSARRKV